jgi:hypothetical protein
MLFFVIKENTKFFELSGIFTKRASEGVSKHSLAHNIRVDHGVVSKKILIRAYLV